MKLSPDQQQQQQGEQSSLFHSLQGKNHENQSHRQPVAGFMINGDGSTHDLNLGNGHCHLEATHHLENGQSMSNGHLQGSPDQETLMSHHLHRMEFNGSGSDTSNSSGTSSGASGYHQLLERNGDHGSHQRVSDIAYPMMNLEEFIHQQTSGFSDQDSGSDRGDYGKSSYDAKPVIQHHGKPLAHLSTDFSPSDLALATNPDSQYQFDPSNVRFNSDELKPQPIISKSRKTLVPDGMKDNRYWARRAKNNVAAKRSREARRLKENQIILRASYLEKENQALKASIDRLTKENELLKRQQIYSN